MLDLILLAGLFLLTTGISFLLYFTNIWKEGVWWGFFWGLTTFSVLIFEGLSKLVSGRTLTQHIRAWGKESERNKWIARGIVIAFALGALCLMTHLWVF